MSQYQGSWRHAFEPEERYHPAIKMEDRLKPVLPPEVEGLPLFESTEAAEEFGRTASPENVRRLKIRRAFYLQLGHDAKAKKDIDAAAQYYTYAMFDREALQTAPNALQLGETL